MVVGSRGTAQFHHLSRVVVVGWSGVSQRPSADQGLTGDDVVPHQFFFLPSRVLTPCSNLERAAASPGGSS